MHLTEPGPAALPADWVNLVNTPQTEAEVAALRRCVQRGQPYGSEANGWGDTISAASFEAAETEAQMSMYGANYYRNFVYQDRNWSFHGFDLDKGRADAERVVGKTMNADDVTFKGFKAHGGKFIQYAESSARRRQIQSFEISCGYSGVQFG